MTENMLTPEKKQKIEEQILRLEELNKEHRQKILDEEKTSVVEDRMKGLAEFIQMKAFDAKRKIPSTVIDQYVEQIIFDKGVFTWILNPALGNQLQRLTIDTSGMKKNCSSQELLCRADTGTGCYRSEVVHRAQRKKILISLQRNSHCVYCVMGVFYMSLNDIAFSKGAC